jgi:steroid 5-alpha reductase family enzyme
MKKWSSHPKSMVELGFIYFIAIALGIITYLWFEIDNAILRMLVADLVATMIVWFHGIIRHNSSVYDPYWSVIPPLIVLGWVIEYQADFNLPLAFLFFAILLWSIRLTANWAKGWTDFSDQDWRYVMIRKQAPRLWFISNFFGINLMPTLIVFIQLAGSHRFIQNAQELNVWVVLGFLISLFAIAIEFISDHQMAEFRIKNKGKHQCIDEGLWHYSRHPNYFGEVSMWWGVWLMYFGVQQVIDYTVIAPILMTCLFLFISIPMMEKKILASRPAYRKYQKSVSILVPFFRHSENSEDESVRERN